MYQNDAEVERDVEMLRRRLREEPVERQVQIRKHTTMNDSERATMCWWVISVPQPTRRQAWFAFDRNARGKLEVRERANKVELLAEVATVEAAMMAGMMMVDRPS